MLAGGRGGAWSQNVDCDIFPLHYLSYICLWYFVCVCVSQLRSAQAFLYVLVIKLTKETRRSSCSIELYKQWYTLADFSQTGIFGGFSLYIMNLTVGISEAAMGREHYMF
jgi:hypothetical protein